MRNPKVNVDCIQNTEERESPRDTLDDDVVSSLLELVDDGTEEEEVNDRPIITKLVSTSVVTWST